MHHDPSDVEAVSYMKDGMIDDWDLFENVLSYAYSQCIKSDSELHPVLMSEAPVSYSDERITATCMQFCLCCQR